MRTVASTAPWWFPLLPYAMAAVGLVNHVLFRRGIAQHRALDFYFNPSCPSLVRNRPFVQLPVAVAFALGGVPAVVLTVKDPLPPSAALFGVVGFLWASIWGLKEALHPSPWRKPKWLVEEETRRGWSGDMSPGAARAALVRGAEVYRCRDLYVIDPWQRQAGTTLPAGTVRCIPGRGSPGRLGAAVLEALDDPVSRPGHTEADRYQQALTAAGLPSWSAFRRKARVVPVGRNTAGDLLVGPATPRAAGFRSHRAGAHYRVDDLNEFGPRLETALLSW